MGTVESAKKKIDTKQAKHYRKLISKSKDAFLILNSQAKIINANNPSVKLFQAKNKKQLTSITFFVLCVTEQQSFPKLSLDQIKDKIAKQALESTTGFADFEFHQITLKNYQFWAHVWVNPINLSGELVFQIMLRSITGPGDKSVLELNQSEVLIGTQTANHLQTITDTETKKSDQSQETNELSDGAFTKENSVTSVTQFFVFDDEPEEKLKKEIDTIKSNIRSLDNPELEQKVVNGLNQIKKEFTTVVEQLQSHVQKLSTKFVKEREDRETEYAKLESHLQKSLLNSKKMMEENKLLKKAFFEMKDLLNSKDLSTIVKDSDNQN